MNILKIGFILLFASVTVGCGAIDTGNAGVRTSWDNKVQDELEGEGFYTAVISSVEEYVGKEILVELENMTPKAGDNLTMQDLDVQIYYKTAISCMPGLKVKYANAHRTVKQDGNTYIWPAYARVYGQAREAVYDAMSSTDSLEIHKNRDALRPLIKTGLQEILEASDPGCFEISTVVIKDAKTDPSLEAAIRLATQKDKELEAMEKEVEIKEKLAEANDKLAPSLSPNIMRIRELEAMVEACQNNTCIIDFTEGDSVQPLVNIPNRR
jgi:hypothetical protein